MAFEMNDLKGFLFMVLLAIPMIASTNINCSGKAFHCVNSTHFMICVELGGGVSSTIDDFVIPCPPSTVCHEHNIFECEFPKFQTTIPPPLEVIGVYKQSDTSAMTTVIDSVTDPTPLGDLLNVFKENITVTTPLVPEEVTGQKLEVLESMKQLTGANSEIVTDTTIVNEVTFSSINGENATVYDEQSNNNTLTNFSDIDKNETVTAAEVTGQTLDVLENMNPKQLTGVNSGIVTETTIVDEVTSSSIISENKTISGEQSNNNTVTNFSDIDKNKTVTAAEVTGQTLDVLENMNPKQLTGVNSKVVTETPIVDEVTSSYIIGENKIVNDKQPNNNTLTNFSDLDGVNSEIVTDTTIVDEVTSSSIISKNATVNDKQSNNNTLINFSDIDKNKTVTAAEVTGQQLDVLENMKQKQLTGVNSGTVTETPIVDEVTSSSSISENATVNDKQSNNNTLTNFSDIDTNKTVTGAEVTGQTLEELENMKQKQHTGVSSGIVTETTTVNEFTSSYIIGENKTGNDEQSNNNTVINFSDIDKNKTVTATEVTGQQLDVLENMNPKQLTGVNSEVLTETPTVDEVTSSSIISDNATVNDKQSNNNTLTNFNDLDKNETVTGAEVTRQQLDVLENMKQKQLTEVNTEVITETTIVDAVTSSSIISENATVNDKQSNNNNLTNFNDLDKNETVTGAEVTGQQLDVLENMKQKQLTGVNSEIITETIIVDEVTSSSIISENATVNDKQSNNNTLTNFSNIDRNKTVVNKSIDKTGTDSLTDKSKSIDTMTSVIGIIDVNATDLQGVVNENTITDTLSLDTLNDKTINTTYRNTTQNDVKHEIVTDTSIVATGNSSEVSATLDATNTTLAVNADHGFYINNTNNDTKYNNFHDSVDQNSPLIIYFGDITPEQQKNLHDLAPVKVNSILDSITVVVSPQITTEQTLVTVDSVDFITNDPPNAANTNVVHDNITASASSSYNNNATTVDQFTTQTLTSIDNTEIIADGFTTPEKVTFSEKPVINEVMSTTPKINTYTDGLYKDENNNQFFAKIYSNRENISTEQVLELSTTLEPITVPSFQTPNVKADSNTEEIMTSTVATTLTFENFLINNAYVEETTTFSHFNDVVITTNSPIEFKDNLYQINQESNETFTVLNKTTEKSDPVNSNSSKDVSNDKVIEYTILPTITKEPLLSTEATTILNTRSVDKPSELIFTDIHMSDIKIGQTPVSTDLTTNLNKTELVPNKKSELFYENTLYAMDYTTEASTTVLTDATYHAYVKETSDIQTTTIPQLAESSKDTVKVVVSTMASADYPVMNIKDLSSSKSNGEDLVNIETTTISIFDSTESIRPTNDTKSSMTLDYDYYSEGIKTELPLGIMKPSANVISHEPLTSNQPTSKPQDLTAYTTTTVNYPDYKFAQVGESVSNPITQFSINKNLGNSLLSTASSQIAPISIISTGTETPLASTIDFKYLKTAKIKVDAEQKTIQNISSKENTLTEHSKLLDSGAEPEVTEKSLKDDSFIPKETLNTGSVHNEGTTIITTAFVMSPTPITYLPTTPIHMKDDNVKLIVESPLSTSKIIERQTAGTAGNTATSLPILSATTEAVITETIRTTNMETKLGPEAKKYIDDIRVHEILTTDLPNYQTVNYDNPQLTSGVTTETNFNSVPEPDLMVETIAVNGDNISENYFGDKIISNVMINNKSTKTSSNSMNSVKIKIDHENIVIATANQNMSFSPKKIGENVNHTEKDSMRSDVIIDNIKLSDHSTEDVNTTKTSDLKSKNDMDLQNKALPINVTSTVQFGHKDSKTIEDIKSPYTFTTNPPKIASKIILNTEQNYPVNTSDVKQEHVEVNSTSSYHQLSLYNNTFNDTLEQHLTPTNHTIMTEIQSHLNESDKQANKMSHESKLSITTIVPTTHEKLKDNKAINASASLFDCTNHTRGKYADQSDCRKFYTCIGNLQPIVGICPNGTVFSEINKQCTRNLSHCVRNNQFHCLYEGRFSDFFKDNMYYICVKNSMNKFYRYKLQCQAGYHLNKVLVKCEKNIESQSASSMSENSKINNDEGKPKTETEESKKTIPTVDFECDKEGRFPHEKDCRKYFICTKVKNEYRRKLKKCSNEEAYDRKKKKCVESESDEC